MDGGTSEMGGTTNWWKKALRGRRPAAWPRGGSRPPRSCTWRRRCSRVECTSRRRCSAWPPPGRQQSAPRTEAKAGADAVVKRDKSGAKGSSRGFTGLFAGALLPPLKVGC